MIPTSLQSVVLCNDIRTGRPEVPTDAHPGLPPDCPATYPRIPPFLLAMEIAILAVFLIGAVVALIVSSIVHSGREEAAAEAAERERLKEHKEHEAALADRIAVAGGPELAGRSR